VLGSSLSAGWRTGVNEEPTKRSEELDEVKINYSKIKIGILTRYFLKKIG
jgi:hypothetical protein